MAKRQLRPCRSARRVSPAETPGLSEPRASQCGCVLVWLFTMLFVTCLVGRLNLLLEEDVKSMLPGSQL